MRKNGHGNAHGPNLKFSGMRRLSALKTIKFHFFSTKHIFEAKSNENCNLPAAPTGTAGNIFIQILKFSIGKCIYFR